MCVNKVRIKNVEFGVVAKTHFPHLPALCAAAHWDSILLGLLEVVSSIVLVVVWESGNL
jgi:hypothetical protein